MKPDVIAVIRQKYRILDPELNERTRRLWAAAEAEAAGRGGVTEGGQGNWAQSASDYPWPSRVAAAHNERRTGGR